MTEPEPASGGAVRPAESVGFRSRSFPEWLPLAVVFGAVVVSIVVAIAITPNFLTWANALAILRTTAIVGIVAVGMTPMTLSGSLVSLGAHQSAMASAIAFIALVGDGRQQFAGFEDDLIDHHLVRLGAAAVIGQQRGDVIAEDLGHCWRDHMLDV